LFTSFAALDHFPCAWLQSSGSEQSVLDGCPKVWARTPVIPVHRQTRQCVLGAVDSIEKVHQRQRGSLQVGEGWAHLVVVDLVEGRSLVGDIKNTGATLSGGTVESDLRDQRAVSKDKLLWF
jgi:hypothetical protein